MLSLRLLDKEAAQTLQLQLYGEILRGVTVAAEDDGIVLGIANYTIDECAHLVAVAVFEQYRGYGYGDFLTRSLMNSFSLSGLTIAVDYPDNKHYYDKFGFALKNDMLCVDADTIVFPCKCHN